MKACDYILLFTVLVRNSSVNIHCPALLVFVVSDAYCLNNVLNHDIVYGWWVVKFD